MDADTTIVPVAVVADVRELLSSKYVPVMQQGSRDQVAGEYSYSVLEWMANAAPAPKRIILDSIIMYAVTATTMRFGFSTSGIAGSPDALPRRKVGSLQASSVAGRIVSGTSVSDPTTIINLRAGIVSLQAGITYELVFREPIILDREGQFYAIGANTPNTSIRSTWQWREERP